MLRSELVMMHINDGCLLQFYLHMTLTSLDTIWIMFKKGFVLYLPNRELIQIVTVIQAQPVNSLWPKSTLFSFELE
jgi:hypothetical protein